MSWSLLFALQVAVPVVGDAPSFDLRNIAPFAGCAAAKSDEILVCGVRDPLERNRLKPLPDVDYDDPLIAEIGIIGNVRGSATIDSFSLGQGVVSNRAMINIKIPF